MIEPGPKKQYLGDGVYVTFDGYHIWLTTENGMRETNRIALDPNVQVALIAYFERIVKDFL